MKSSIIKQFVKYVILESSNDDELSSFMSAPMNYREIVHNMNERAIQLKADALGDYVEAAEQLADDWAIIFSSFLSKPADMFKFLIDMRRELIKFSRDDKHYLERDVFDAFEWCTKNIYYHQALGGYENIDDELSNEEYESKMTALFDSVIQGAIDNGQAGINLLKSTFLYTQDRTFRDFFKKFQITKKDKVVDAETYRKLLTNFERKLRNSSTAQEFISDVLELEESVYEDDHNYESFANALADALENHQFKDITQNVLDELYFVLSKSPKRYEVLLDRLGS